MATPEATYTFTPYADHYQFYLGDSAFDADTASPDYWSDAAHARRLAIAPPSQLGVGTAVYDVVMVTVEVYATDPHVLEDGWDHVVEASLALPSGRMALDGCLDYHPEASQYRLPEWTLSPHLTVSPGTYRVRIYGGELGNEEIIGTTPEGMDIVKEHYRVIMWPALYTAPVVLYTRDQPSSSSAQLASGA